MTRKPPPGHRRAVPRLVDPTSCSICGLAVVTCGKAIGFDVTPIFMGGSYRHRGNCLAPLARRPKAAP